MPSAAKMLLFGAFVYVRNAGERQLRVLISTPIPLQLHSHRGPLITLPRQPLNTRPMDSSFRPV